MRGFGGEAGKLRCKNRAQEKCVVGEPSQEKKAELNCVFIVNAKNEVKEFSETGTVKSLIRVAMHRK